MRRFGQIKDFGHYWCKFISIVTDLLPNATKHLLPIVKKPKGIKSHEFLKIYCQLVGKTHVVWSSENTKLRGMDWVNLCAEHTPIKILEVCKDIAFPGYEAESPDSTR